MPICAANAVALDVAGRVVVVVVEPALPDRDRRTRPAPSKQVGDRVDAVARLVRVQADRGVHVRDGGAAQSSAASDVARSQPTVIIVVDAGGARPSATAASAPPGMRASS